MLRPNWRSACRIIAKFPNTKPRPLYRAASPTPMLDRLKRREPQLAPFQEIGSRLVDVDDVRTRNRLHIVTSTGAPLAGDIVEPGFVGSRPWRARSRTRRPAKLGKSSRVPVLLCGNCLQPIGQFVRAFVAVEIPAQIFVPGAQQSLVHGAVAKLDSEGVFDELRHRDAALVRLDPVRSRPFLRGYRLGRGMFEARCSRRGSRPSPAPLRRSLR